VRETLFAVHPGGRRTYVASSTRRQLAARRYRLSIRLSAPYRQALMLRHHLSLSLTITIVTVSGRQRTYMRWVTLTR